MGKVFGCGGIRITSRSGLPQGSGMGTSSVLAGERGLTYTPFLDLTSVRWQVLLKLVMGRLFAQRRRVAAFRAVAGFVPRPPLVVARLRLGDHAR